MINTVYKLRRRQRWALVARRRLRTRLPGSWAILSEAARSHSTLDTCRWKATTNGRFTRLFFEGRNARCNATLEGAGGTDFLGPIHDGSHGTSRSVNAARALVSFRIIHFLLSPISKSQTGWVSCLLIESKMSDSHADLQVRIYFSFSSNSYV